MYYPNNWTGTLTVPPPVMKQGLLKASPRPAPSNIDPVRATTLVLPNDIPALLPPFKVNVPETVNVEPLAINQLAFPPVAMEPRIPRLPNVKPEG